jgi:tetratricopeptide (TPR) repeat protein
MCSEAIAQEGEAQMNKITRISFKSFKKHIKLMPIQNNGDRPVKYPHRFYVLEIGCLALVMGCLSFVQPVTAHPEMDPEIAKLTEALTKDPNNVELLISRGQIYRSNGNYLESLQDFENAWLVDRQNQVITLERAMTLSALGRDQEAEAALDSFLQDPSHPKRVFGLAERAHIRARTGRLEQAIADFTSAIQLQPTIELFLTRGQLQEKLGNLEAAAEGYHEGLAQLGDAILLKKGLIRVHIAQNQYGQALALINQEAARSAVKTPWYLQRGEILTKMGRSQDSRRTYEQALAEANRILGKRSTAMQLLARAKVFHAMGRVEEAKSDLREAVQKAPNWAEAEDLLKQLENQ